MSPLARIVITSVLALVATGCGADRAPTSDGAAAGPAASQQPDGDGASGGDGSTLEQATASLSADTLDGEEFDFARLEGSPTVLWFWAPWCTICRAEAPDVVETAEALGEEVTLIGVPGRGAEEDMAAFVADTGTGGLEHVVDADGSIWSSFGVVSQPAFAFIDADGEVELVNGSLTGDQLEQAARSMLG